MASKPSMVKHHFNTFYLLYFQASVGRQKFLLHVSFCLCCKETRENQGWSSVEGTGPRNTGTPHLQPPWRTPALSLRDQSDPTGLGLVSSLPFPYNPAGDRKVTSCCSLQCSSLQWPFFKFRPSSRLSPSAGLGKPKALILYVSLAFWHLLFGCIRSWLLHVGPSFLCAGFSLVAAWRLRSLQPVGS